MTNTPDTLRKASSWLPSAATTGSSSPNASRSASGTARKTAPMSAATPIPIHEATRAPCTDRSGLPAPRFCPAIAAVAPMIPTEVQVTSEKSCV